MESTSAPKRALGAVGRSVRAVGRPVRAVGRPVRAVGRGIRRVSARLAEGLSIPLLVAVAVLALFGLLYTVASRDPHKPRGYAEFTMFRRGCLVDQARQQNAATCLFVAPGVYRVGFSADLEGSTVVASRGTCCPGRIAASIETDRTVLVLVQRRVRRPIRASLVIP